MTDTETFLIELLAETHAVWHPARRHRMPLSGIVTIWEHREAYASQGLPYASGERTEAGRKGSQRRLETLAKEGLIQTFRSAGRSIGVKLTPKGLHLAEHVACQANVKVGFQTLQRFLALRAEGHDRGYLSQFKGWLPETLLAGHEWGERSGPFAALEWDMAPALSRGWLISETSIQGHCWYSATKEGERAAKDANNGKLPDYLPPDNTHTLEEYEAAADYYFDCYRDSRDRLASLASKSINETGPIALPVAYAKGRTNA